VVWGAKGGGLGGSLRIDLEPIRFDTLQFWHRFESIRDIAYFCQAWPHYPALDRHKISYLNDLQRKMLIISQNYSSSRYHWTSFRFPPSTNCRHPNQGMTSFFPPTTTPTVQPILWVDFAYFHVLGNNSSNQRPAVMTCVWRRADMTARDLQVPIRSASHRYRGRYPA
jgi:hypothetical protein